MSKETHFLEAGLWETCLQIPVKPRAPRPADITGDQGAKAELLCTVTWIPPDFYLCFTSAKGTFLPLVTTPAAPAMNENEFEGLPENDWDDAWDFSWSEFDWERHLQDQDKVLRTYLAHYDRLVDRPDRIDEVARRMGWEEQEWTNDDEDEANLSAEAPDFSKSSDSAPAMDPYTIHKHPVYISTHAIFSWLNRTWEFVAPACGSKVPVRTAVAYATSLARGEHLGTLATHSLDMGDFALCVSQSKRALAEMNVALSHLHALDDSVHPALAQYKHQAQIRLFDIREIWLRVMRDCRDEIQRRVNDNGET